MWAMLPANQFVDAAESSPLPPPPQGVALIVIPAGGGAPLLVPLPPSLGPAPPSPLRSNSPENQGSGNVFSFGPIFFSRAFGAPIAGFFGHSLCPFFPLLQTPCPSVP